jgi:hypothetical protein
MIKLINRIILAKIGIVLLLVAVPSQARSSQTAPAFMTEKALAEALADGKSWNWTVPDGKAGKMVLHKDGSGILEGPITIKVRWAIKGQYFCIKMGVFLGTKCLTGFAVNRGYQTYLNKKPGFLFYR